MNRAVAIALTLCLSGCGGTAFDRLVQSVDSTAAADQGAALKVAQASGNKAAIDCVTYLVSVSKEPCGPGQDACVALKTVLYAQAPIGECAAFNAQIKATAVGLLAVFGL